ncbi:Motile sperm domain-containing protein 2 [Halotydeus destructor]|nr:Motile sperm domain-containing protein 2 [Halotydeus destructor]
MAETSEAVSSDYSKDTLVQVRSKLKEEHDKSAELFDEKEYNRLVEDDQHLSRYMKRKKGDPVLSVPFLVNLLKWRKSFGISDLTEQSFPREFYDLGGIHVYESDKDGNVVLYVRIKFFSKVPEILDLLKKFAVFQMFKADDEAHRKGVGWVLLFDCSATGLANVDMDMVNFVNVTLRHYFPSGQQYVLAHNVPWLLNALKTIMWSVLPANVKRRIKFSNDKTITDYIPADHLPAYILGGSCPRDFRFVPKVALATDDLVSSGTLKFDEAGQLRVRKYYEKLYATYKIKEEVEVPAIGVEAEAK